MTKVDDDIEERLNNAEKKEKPNPFAGFNGGPQPDPPPGGGKKQKAPPTEQEFPFTSFEEIDFSTDPAYRVKGILPREGVGDAWGRAKSGKSFWAYDLSMHVALGWPYRGRRVKQCCVAYLALECPWF